MEIDKVIAENLRKLREQQNLSLGQLAERTGLSKVMLGQLEKGGANPTINNIWKITAALGVPYTALLDTTGSAACVVRREDMPTQSNEDGHYRLVCYYPSAAERSFEWFRMELDGGCRYTSVGHRDRALEYIVVLSGELRLETQGQLYTLAAGDSISFQAAETHTYCNETAAPVVASIINYYP